MNVNDFDKYISSYLDGELRLSLMKEFEELLDSNSECKAKLESYKLMLKELSNLETLKTSDTFLDGLHDKINKPIKKTLIQRIENINFLGYDYISMAGIAAAISMFILSVSIFINSDFNLSTADLDKTLYNKNVQVNSSKINNDDQLLTAEEDTLNENNLKDIPIHLVGTKK